LAILPTGLHH